MDLEKRVQRLQGNFQPGLEGKGSFGYGTFLPMVDGASKISSKRSREQPSQTTNSQVSNSQVRNNQSSHTSVAPDPTIDDMASQIPKSSAETSSPSKIIQVMTIPLGPLLSPFVSVPSAIDPVIEHTSTVQQEVKPEQQLEPQMETVVQQMEPQQDQVVQPQPEVSLEKIEEPTPEKGQLDSSQVHSKGPESDTQLPLPKQENKDIEKPLKAPKEKKEPENGVSIKSQTPEMQHSKEKKEKSVLDSSTSNEATKDRKSKLDKSRTDDKKTKEREESKEKKEKKLKDGQRSKEKKKEKEVDKKKDKREQTRTRSTSRSSSRSRSRERDRGRNYDRDRDYKEKRRRRSYSYSSDNGNSSSPARSRYSSSDSERDYDRKRRRKGKSRSRSRDRKDRDKDRKDRSDRSKSKKRKRESRDRGTTKAEDSRKSKSAITEILITETTNLSVTSAKDASAIAEECKKNATKLKHVADKLSDKSQAGEIYFQSGLQFLACAHAYEEGSMHDKAVMMYQQTGTFFESIAKMYSHDEKFKVLVSMCCKCVAVALSRRFILDPSRLRQLHSDLSLIGSTSGTNNTVPNSPPSSTQGNNLDPSPPQPPVSTSPSLPPANTERSSTSSSSTQSQPTVRLKGEKQQNLFDMIKCFEMWGRAEKNLAIQHHSMTNVKELIQSLTQYAKTNLATSSTTDV